MNEVTGFHWGAIRQVIAGTFLLEPGRCTGSRRYGLPATRRLLWAIAAVAVLILPSRGLAQGIYVSASGPVHGGMAGASTAAPIDALGAMYWNSATISGLRHSEVAFGMDLLYSNHRVASTAGGISGATKSENGFFPIPAVAWVYHTPNPAVTLGLSVQGIAGFKTNLRSDPTNPVLAPQPVGLGQVSSEAAFLQIVPAVSVAVRDNLSVGFGPTVTVGQIGVDPFVGDSPNVDGRYPSGRATRQHWGGGAQAGVYYIHDEVWHFGASIKSPQWMETFRFFSEDAAGAPRVLRANINLPLILSFGTAYSGIEDWLFAVDIRYFDYKNTDGFGDPAVFDADGALSGLGWDSVMAVALGVQRRVSDRAYLRAGYKFNESPIGHRETFFNVASPLHNKHLFSSGMSYMLSPAVAFNAAYSYVLPNELTGPLVAPNIGPIPNASISNRTDAHVVSLGITTRY